MEKMRKLNRAATALWTRHDDVPKTNLTSRQRRQFETWENAARFVMDELTDIEKVTSLILTDDGSYRFDEIREIYARSDFKSV